MTGVMVMILFKENVLSWHGLKIGERVGRSGRPKTTVHIHPPAAKILPMPPPLSHPPQKSSNNPHHQTQPQPRPLRPHPLRYIRISHHEPQTHILSNLRLQLQLHPRPIS